MGKHRRTALIVIAVLAATVTATGLAAALTSSAPTGQVASPTVSEPAALTPTVTPTPAAAVTATAAPAPADKPVVVFTPRTGGSTGGSSAGTNPTPKTPSTPKVTSTPKPSTRTYCPDTRADDPTLWDACRAGYAAPTVTFRGPVACVKTDEFRNGLRVWKVTFAFDVTGGTHKGYDWFGAPDGKVTYSMAASETDDTGQLTGERRDNIYLGVGLRMYPMNGMKGYIDEVQATRGPNYTLSLCVGK